MIVKSLNTPPPAIVVPVSLVEGGGVVVEEVLVVDGPLEEDVVTELEAVVDVGGVVSFLSLLHAESATRATTAIAATVGAGR